MLYTSCWRLRPERQGNAVEIATLGQFLRQWLFQRGFENDAEIEELAKVSGTSIGRCIHMLISVLRDRRPRKSSEKHGIEAAARPRNMGVCSAESMRAVSELFDEKEQRLK